MTDDSIENDIAIVGMSGRYPKAPDLDTFWQNLKYGQEGIRFFSDSELIDLGVPREYLREPNFVKAAAVIDSVDHFDAGFFGYSPKEAKLLDPQQRIFLECAWHTLEQGGYNPETYPGTIGVFGSSTFNTYLFFNILKNHHYSQQREEFELMIGNDKNFLSTRTAYHLNLTGPAVDIQTACSSSLVAIHFGCNSLLNYECDMALAGGISLSVPQRTGYFYKKGTIVSPDGRCRAFDKNSQGTIFGNGVGIILLKRLSDALEDNDTIHGVIKSSAINNDGSNKVGFTAPGVDGQVEIISRALALADIAAESINYVEAHGTGTDFGDPVEIAALTKAFYGDNDSRSTGFCAVGSVKTNIGHLDAAAGVTGVIKTLLALKHKEIPPTLHYTDPNPQIDFKNSPFYVNSVLKQWPRYSTPRRACVNSLGIGGTNAFIVMEEAPVFSEAKKSVDKQEKKIILLSARSKEALKAASANLFDHFTKNKTVSLKDVAYTMHVGRKLFPYRRFLICKSISDCIQKLQSVDREKNSFIHCDWPNKQTAFFFPNYNSSGFLIGQELYGDEPVYQKAFNRCAHIVLSLSNIDIRTIPADKEGKNEKISWLFPLACAREYALGQLLIAKGIKPDKVVGIGMGQFNAACIAGIMSIEDSLSIVNAYIVELEKHNILSISELPSISEKSWQEICAAITLEVKKAELNAPEITLINISTGSLINKEEASNPDYWGNILKNQAEYQLEMPLFYEETDYLFFEIGPENEMNTITRARSDSEKPRLTFPLIPTKTDSNSDRDYLLEVIGTFICNGGTIDTSQYYKDKSYQRIPLPGYPFERQSYWVYPQKANKPAAPKDSGLEKNSNPDYWFYMPSWQRTSVHPIIFNNEKEETWLVFCKDDSFSKALVTLLKKYKQNVYTVFPGEKYKKNGDTLFTISPFKWEGYKQLLAEMGSKNKPPEKVIYLWSGQDSPSFDNMKLYGYDVLIQLVKAWEENTFLPNAAWWICGTNMFKVEHKDTVNPYTKMFCGLAKVINQESKKITCFTIDINFLDENNVPGFLTEMITASDTAEIAYRGKYRYIPSPQPLVLKKRAPEICQFRKKGTYLITGGMGKMGLLFAGYLAREYKANLILIGRRTFPGRDTWNDEAANNTLFSTAIKNLQELEAAGTKILVKSVDIANPEQLEKVIQESINHFGALHGIIHCAGITGSRAVRSIEEYHVENKEEQFEAKIKGTFNIAKITENMKLDFVLLTSSITSALGGVGLSAYTAANMFLDGIVQSKLTGSNRWLSMNLDWIDFENQGHKTTGIDKFAIKPEELIDIFCRVVTQSTEEQVFVSTGDLAGRIKSLKNEQEKKPLQENHCYSARPELSVPYVAPISEMEKIIINIWSQELEIEKIGRNDNFFELGGSSLIAINVASKIKSKLNIDLPAVSMYEALTPQSLAEELSKLEKEMTTIEDEKKATLDDKRYRRRNNFLQNQQSLRNRR